MMSKLRKSPNRGKFHIDNEMKRVAEGKKTLSEALSIIELHESWNLKISEEEQSEKFKKNNLEYDLRTSEYIAEKCKVEHYAQNLYAALCNNDFVKNDVWPILTDEAWGCSWRYAGGIVADIRQEGDYIDWYCSGIIGHPDDDKIGAMTDEQKNRYQYMQKYFVSEGIVTDEIREDLFKIGWLVKDNSDTDS